jgi:large subunit ribosomal protein L17
MRHRVKGRKLNRTESHRDALMRNMATSLFKHKRIKTTLAKAKEARGYVERLITKAKKNDLHSRRVVMQDIKEKDIVQELFGEIITKIGERPGGYTRVIKLGNRNGDAAPMAILELVDYNDVINKKEEKQKEKREARAQAKKESAKSEQVEDAKVIEESSSR